jgi:hypothetical protein
MACIKLSPSFTRASILKRMKIECPSSELQILNSFKTVGVCVYACITGTRACEQEQTVFIFYTVRSTSHLNFYLYYNIFSVYERTTEDLKDENF